MSIDSVAGLNSADRELAQHFLGNCCGSTAWIDAMANGRPYSDGEAILQSASTVWNALTKADWLEAFGHHPKIGDMASLRHKYASTAEMASAEQAGAENADESLLSSLADQNSAYEQKFGYIFIVFATGKSAEEMLNLLHGRLMNNADDEIAIAAAEQSKITRQRLISLLLLSEEMH